MEGPLYNVALTNDAVSFRTSKLCSKFSALCKSSVCLVFIPGPGCSKLTTSLVNVSLKFQRLISQICQYFFVEKK